MAYSTSRMEFLDARPMSRINPIIAGNDKELFATRRAVNAPPIDSGSAADSFPDRGFTGRLSFISDEAEFTPKTVQTTKERVTMVYRIKVDLENPDGVLKPGMPVDAYLQPIATP